MCCRGRGSRIFQALICRLLPVSYTHPTTPGSDGGVNGNRHNVKCYPMKDIFTNKSNLDNFEYKFENDDYKFYLTLVGTRLLPSLNLNI